MKLCESMGVNYKNAGSLEGLIVELLCSIYCKKGCFRRWRVSEEKGLIVVCGIVLSRRRASLTVILAINLTPASDVLQLHQRNYQPPFPPPSTTKKQNKTRGGDK